MTDKVRNPETAAGSNQRVNFSESCFPVVFVAQMVENSRGDNYIVTSFLKRYCPEIPLKCSDFTGIDRSDAFLSPLKHPRANVDKIAIDLLYGFKNGQRVTISDMTTATEVNATWHIQYINSKMFAIPVVTTGAGAAGSVVGVAESFTLIAGCKDITLPSAATDEVDITTHDSQGKEYMEGDTDYGEVGFDINYDPSEPTHVTLRQMSQAVPKVTANWQAIMTDTGNEEWDFEGWVKTFTLSAPVSGVYTATVAIRVTGAPQVTA